MRDVDTIVIGGGIVGLSVAYGFARAGESVRVLDEGDDAFRAARGNFGLVWVQGKGAEAPEYARWTMKAAALWPQFSQELADQCGIDVELSQPGGLTMCLTEEELSARADQLTRLRDDLAEPYPFEVLRGPALRAEVPETGPEVAGAVMCPMDGHVSPLRLLHALLRSFEHIGGAYHSGHKVSRIVATQGGFSVSASGENFAAARVVLAAGLGNTNLAPMVGLNAPVRPVRGQVLVTERLQPFLRHPTLHVRQTGEGVIQIGDSKEDVGFDDGTTLSELARIAARAVKFFPLLKDVNIVRTWGALRVMSPDGLPIYQASTRCPGAFLITCHSGITLAAQHAGALVDWMRGGMEPDEIKGFKAERFNVVSAH